MNNKKMPSVLVGTTASSNKSYILEKYLNRIIELSYPNYDLSIVVSQKDENYGMKIAQMLEDRNFWRFEIIIDAWVAKPQLRVTSHHNKLREVTLLEEYDYLFIVDQDIIPPVDAIEQLISVGGDVVTGLYKIKHNDTIVNCVWKRRMVLKNGKLCANWYTDDEISNDPIEIDGGFGTGCCLIKKDVLNYVYFRAGANNNNFQDGIFWFDVKNMGFKTFLNGNVKCEHFQSNWDPLFEEYVKEVKRNGRRDETIQKNKLDS